jgi:hypothetical protein
LNFKLRTGTINYNTAKALLGVGAKKSNLINEIAEMN